MSNAVRHSPSGIIESPRAAALIVAGAAGKGPYAAGALAVLAGDARFDVRTVVGASSGALNAAVYAAGLRAGAAADAAEHLCELWRDRARFERILGHKARVGIVLDALERFRERPRDRAVSLEVVVASLPGTRDRFGHVRFERAFRFHAADFEDRRRLRDIAETAVASAALPVLFAPRHLAGEGPFWDGGIVNNAPIGRVLKSDDEIDHVIVVTPDALELGGGSYSRFSVGRLLTMLVDERLARDLYEAKAFNEDLAVLEANGIRLRELGDLGWRILELIEIRPDRTLPGNLLSGFVSKPLRATYIESGRQAAGLALERFRPRARTAATDDAERAASTG